MTSQVTLVTGLGKSKLLEREQWSLVNCLRTTEGSKKEGAQLMHHSRFKAVEIG